MEKATFTAKNYLTTFHTGQDEQGNWKAWKEHMGKVQDEKYCLNEDHAKRTRTALINAFWGNKLN